MTTEQLTKGTIVDVRTRGEFAGGNVANSLNFPLQELHTTSDKLKALPQPLILCCASGNRSGQAEQYLKSLGIDCVNGGSWMDVNYLQAQLTA
ncbi:Rhodanese-related sulfurtransferase [Spirosomataceae bacterium TFI 002]|nr:Rhodanese-related sulfurtransferase [Spirosomataceae bacterium TFI 002]